MPQAGQFEGWNMHVESHTTTDLLQGVQVNPAAGCQIELQPVVSGRTGDCAEPRKVYDTVFCRPDGVHADIRTSGDTQRTDAPEVNGRIGVCQQQSRIGIGS